LKIENHDFLRERTLVASFGQHNIIVKIYIFVYICIVDGDPIIKGKALGSHNPVYLRHIFVPVSRWNMDFQPHMSWYFL
jgi:hypothetical protein